MTQVSTAQGSLVLRNHATYLQEGRCEMEHRAEEILFPDGSDSIHRAGSCHSFKTLLFTVVDYCPASGWYYQNCHTRLYHRASASSPLFYQADIFAQIHLIWPSPPELAF